MHPISVNPLCLRQLRPLCFFTILNWVFALRIYVSYVTIRLSPSVLCLVVPPIRLQQNIASLSYRPREPAKNERAVAAIYQRQYITQATPSLHSHNKHIRIITHHPLSRKNKLFPTHPALILSHAQ
ncbi:hypothetical protein BC939DRAFT_48979 [Gamsiella multidivaricata]|uniref:uncharacterized protein n=1 Tax=Gamsiella multidivaricata TaxID=101098 RepID=UPI00221FC8DD|nr:uncharacterized protein BC939DRAFT_48979 [Gamsiella multidivaricata]KAI7828731.1 hypothetical protein BC939DRAFT_48979 [Gamsiella multidivaricata]